MTLCAQRNNMTPNEAYEEIARLAAEHALIFYAYGGVITVVHQDTQKREGIYAKCQYIAGLGPFPKDEDELKNSDSHDQQLTKE